MGVSGGEAPIVFESGAVRPPVLGAGASARFAPGTATWRSDDLDDAHHSTRRLKAGP
jgi:hypothetical protein